MSSIDGQMLPKDRIIKAIVNLQKEQPFFGYIVMHMLFNEDERMDRAGVNYKGEVLYNPKFIARLSDREIEGLIVHEALHTGLCHMVRLGRRNKELFNIAADLVVNDILTSSGFVLPRGSMVPVNHTARITINGRQLVLTGLDNRSAEEVYEELEGNVPSIQVSVAIMAIGGDSEMGDGGGEMIGAESNGGQNVEGDDGTPRDGEGNTGAPKENELKVRSNGENITPLDEHEYLPPDKAREAEGKTIEMENKQMMVDARNHSQSKGKMPAGMERLIGKLLPPKVNWKYILQTSMTSSPTDFTYRRPHKKSMASGVYMPSIVREGVDVIVVVDMSGSISRSMLNEFISECVSIGRSFRNIKMTLLSHDSKVQSVLTIDNSTDVMQKILAWKPRGGGGTSHVPVWEWIQKNATSPRLVVCLTDGFTNFGTRPPFDVLWVINPNGINPKDVPFGRGIKMER